MERVVMLRSDDPLAFVADACAALAHAVNEVLAVRRYDSELLNSYAELVLAYSRFVRARLTGDPQATAQMNIIDHLEERLRQARAGEIALPVLDIVDRLHAETTREPASV